MFVNVKILASINGEQPYAIGRLRLTDREAAERDIAGLLRRLADAIESDNPDALPDED